MTLIINPPAMLDDFPLMPHTRQKLEMILTGTIKFPEQKKRSSEVLASRIHILSFYIIVFYAGIT